MHDAPLHDDDGTDDSTLGNIRDSNQASRDSSRFRNNLHPTPQNTILHNNRGGTRGPNTMGPNAMGRRCMRCGSSTMDRNDGIRGSVRGGDHSRNLCRCHRRNLLHILRCTQGRRDSARKDDRFVPDPILWTEAGPAGYRQRNCKTVCHVCCIHPHLGLPKLVLLP